MEDLLQQMKMAMESQMNCEVEVVSDTELSVSMKEGDETKTYTVRISED